jgi:hypothetical protein
VKTSTAALGHVCPAAQGVYQQTYVSCHVICWPQLAPDKLLIRSCAGLTLAGALPSMVQQIRRPSSQGLLLAMANSGFSFFMFAYQVRDASFHVCLAGVDNNKDCQRQLSRNVGRRQQMFPALLGWGWCLPQVLLQVPHE